MALTRKHGDLLNVLKRPVALTVEAGPEICDENLGPLVQPDPPAVESRLIAEARKTFCE